MYRAKGWVPFSRFIDYERLEAVYGGKSGQEVARERERLRKMLE